MTNKEDIKKRILEEEDYIRAPKYQNSLKKFLAKNDPEKVKPYQIAKMLGMTEEEVEAIYQQAVSDLREEMTDED